MSLSVLSVFASASVAEAAPPVTSGDGITVLSTTDISPRTFDVAISTPLVDPWVTYVGNGMRVTLPANYATSNKRYPVLYLLHGATASYQSLTAVLNIEAKASGANAEVIIVTPEGGFGGWYTNWQNNSPAQQWETFHLTQMIPFVDRNFRTIATKQGRAIAGISMGGFGAIRYAQDRPDLFAATASLSGCVDMQNWPCQAAVLASTYGHHDGTGAFGAIGWSPTWGQVSPTGATNALHLATVSTFLYAGSGSDPGESVTTTATNNLHNALLSPGVNIPHFFWNYGAPGATPWGTCNGDHTWPCFNYSFNDALPRLLNVLQDAELIPVACTSSNFQVFTPVQLGKTTYKRGEKITGTVTYKNIGALPCTYSQLLIQVRDTNMTVWDNLTPYSLNGTVAPGATVSLNGSFWVRTTDPLGQYRASGTFQSTNGNWYESTDYKYMTVTQ